VTAVPARRLIVATATPASITTPPPISSSVGTSSCTSHAAAIPMTGTSRTNGTTALAG
jgi:hypothetical protein